MTTDYTSTLHIVFSSVGWQKAQSMVTDQDAVLLCGSAIAMSAAIPSGCSLYVLTDDCQQVGLDAPDTAQAISDEAWVNLVLQHESKVSWA